MYEKKIEYDNKNETIKITISVKRRKKATQEKFRFYSDPFDLIDDKSIKRGEYKLISSPSLTISNINDKIKYTQTGTWVYKKNETRKTRTRKARAKKTTTNKTEVQVPKASSASSRKEEDKLLGIEKLERVSVET